MRYDTDSTQCLEHQGETGGSQFSAHSNNGHLTRGEETRQRLLEAAKTVFARRGYEGASTREIVEVANTNIVAIHYYFGSKQNLYYEAMQSSVHKMAEQFSHVCQQCELLLSQPVLDRQGLRQALVSLLEDTLIIVLGIGDLLGSSGRLCWMQDDGPDCARDIAQNKLEPISRCVRELLSRLTGKAPDSEQIELHCMALLTLVTFPWRDQAILMHNLGWKQLDDERNFQIWNALQPVLLAAIPS